MPLCDSVLHKYLKSIHRAIVLRQIVEKPHWCEHEKPMYVFVLTFHL